MTRATPAVGSTTYGNGNLSRTQLRCTIGLDPETFNVICDREQAEQAKQQGRRQDMFRFNTAFHALSKAATAIRSASQREG